jgi:hypothetical protein
MSAVSPQGVDELRTDLASSARRDISSKPQERRSGKPLYTSPRSAKEHFEKSGTVSPDLIPNIERDIAQANEHFHRSIEETFKPSPEWLRRANLFAYALSTVVPGDVVQWGLPSTITMVSATAQWMPSPPAIALLCNLIDQKRLEPERPAALLLLAVFLEPKDISFTHRGI